MNKKIVFLYLFFNFCLSLPLLARGGGGCVQKGTRIMLSDMNTKKIEELKPGDKILTHNGESGVWDIYETISDKILEIKACGGLINVTPAHSFMIERGIFKEAKYLKKGDRVYIKNQKCQIEKIVGKKSETKVYNLLVFPNQTFIANGFILHNKGCFLPDTLILKQNGKTVKISELKPGDYVLSFDENGNIKNSKVIDIIKIKSDEYFEIKTNKTTLNVTAEHPFFIGNGTFKTLESLKKEDIIYYFDGKSLSPQSIISIKKILKKVYVYNLRVSEPNTFFANFVAVHNKGGGCFIKGTKIKTPYGDKKIEELKKDDLVISYDAKSEKEILSYVISIYKTTNSIIEINTKNSNVLTTSEHPFLTDKGFKEAKKLKEGDYLLTYNKKFKLEKIENITKKVDNETVYNLSVSTPNIFIANGFVVHNKGGGFHSSFHSSYSSFGGNSKSDNIVVFIFILILIISFCFKNKEDDGEELDYLFSEKEIKAKSEKTEKMIEFLSKTDKSLDLIEIKKYVKEVFEKLQQAWQKRDYSEIKDYLMPYIYGKHISQLEIMKNDHEINIISNLEVLSLYIVGLRYTFKEDDRFFTALITAKAKDYYIDDRTNKFIRGDISTNTFQEFWTFKYENKKWLLASIEQTAESNILSKDDFIEHFTDDQKKQILGTEKLEPNAPLGPWADKEVATKAEKIARLLNFLGETDKMWNMGNMEITASLSFLNIYTAWSFLDPAKLSDEYISEGFKESITQLINQKKDEGYSFEFRNLCIRKVEIVLVNNMEDNSKDEYVVRFSAHAQKKVTVNSNMIISDDYVKPFTEYWSFGRENNKWKAKEILPREKGENAVSQENKDEDSSPAQIEWYYTKKRTY